MLEVAVPLAHHAELDEREQRGVQRASVDGGVEVDGDVGVGCGRPDLGDELVDEQLALGAGQCSDREAQQGIRAGGQCDAGPLAQGPGAVSPEPRLEQPRGLRLDHQAVAKTVGEGPHQLVLVPAHQSQLVVKPLARHQQGVQQQRACGPPPLGDRCLVDGRRRSFDGAHVGTASCAVSSRVTSTRASDPAGLRIVVPSPAVRCTASRTAPMDVVRG